MFLFKLLNEMSLSRFCWWSPTKTGTDYKNVMYTSYITFLILLDKIHIG